MATVGLEELQEESKAPSFPISASAFGLRASINIELEICQCRPPLSASLSRCQNDLRNARTLGCADRHLRPTDLRPPISHCKLPQFPRTSVLWGSGKAGQKMEGMLSCGREGEMEIFSHRVTFCPPKSDPVPSHAPPIPVPDLSLCQELSAFGGFHL